MGSGAGFMNSKGNDNTFLGYYSGYNNVSTDGTNGSGNTFVGYQAGRSSGTGSNNVFIGMNAGNGESGSDKLIIDNTGSASPLIYGEFNNFKLRINGTVNIRDLFVLDEEVINTIAAGGTITSTKSNLKLTPAAAIILNTVTPIANGTYVGQLVILRGTDNTNTVTINDSGNVNLDGNHVLGNQDALTLIWDGTSWIQMAFADNTP
jgi:hypothetical protein